jgi:TonB family protein
MKHLFKDEWFISVSTTTILHLLLLSFFLILKINFNPVISEFVEISFAGGFEGLPLETALAQQNITETEKLTELQKNESNISARDIDLPERRTLDLDEQEIVESLPRELNKKIDGPPAPGIKQMPATNLPESKTGQFYNPFLKQEKQADAGVFQKKLDEKLLQGTQKVNIDLNSEFEIDWMGDIKREISQKKLPTFPPDVQREATIKIQFTILPNGLVGSAVLLQKGDTKLENVTLETFKTWRFNPLPEYVTQESQSGIITFRFKLE